jgi:two-component system, LytTR family, sensor kinase
VSRDAGLPLIVVICVTIGLASAGQTYFLRALENEPISLWVVLAVSLPTWLFWAAVTPVIFRLSRRFRLERGSLATALPVHLAAAALFSLLRSVLAVALTREVYPMPATMPPFGVWLRGYIGNRALFELITYFALYGVGVAIEYRRRLRERELQASRLEAQLARAQLQALKMQLHPHFLFNTLHAISVLIREDPAAATRTVALLGDLLRLTLAGAATEEVPLRQELEFLKLYLEIERTRFQDRLDVAYDVPVELLETAVPNFILQPLVENAVRYGVAQRSEPTRIEVRARRRDRAVELRVWNDGPPLDGNGRSDGVGLATTRGRLEKLYGVAGGFDIRNAEAGGVEVMVSVPVDGAREGGARG